MDLYFDNLFLCLTLSMHFSVFWLRIYTVFTQTQEEFFSPQQAWGIIVPHLTFTYKETALNTLSIIKVLPKTAYAQ